MRCIHKHAWERIDFFKPDLAYYCECGAALTIHPGKTYYSPRKLINNRWVWKQVRIPTDEKVRHYQEEVRKRDVSPEEFLKWRKDILGLKEVDEYQEEQRVEVEEMESCPF